MDFDKLFNMDHDAARAWCAERVKGPGKFEGNPLWAPYFYEAMLAGHADESFYDEHERERDVFKLGPHERALFPELNGVTYVVAYEDDYGFFYVRNYTEDELEKATKAAFEEES